MFTQARIAADGRFASALDYDVDGNLLYYGMSRIGSAKSAGAWSIRKFIYADGKLTDILWANGNERFNNVWDDRASITYS